MDSQDEEAARFDDDTQLRPSDYRSSIRSDAKQSEPSALEDDQAAPTLTKRDLQTSDMDVADSRDGVEMIGPRSLSRSYIIPSILLIRRAGPMEPPLDKRRLYLVLLIAALVTVLALSGYPIANISKFGYQV